MHIPPYYKKPSWQRFFAGICVGCIIGYLVFVFMYGQLHEKWIEENLSLRSKLQDLNKSYETLLENHEELSKQRQEGIQIEEVSIDFLNLKELKLDNDRLMIHQLEEAVREEASHAVGKNIDSFSESIDLFISSIENKTIKIDDFAFEATVRRIIVSEQLQLAITLSLGD
ncbi:hypothetical protein J416_08197 [Gracilibacillus halophilus YIM-C55.5]|uniref:Sporulation membrane protein YtrI C-terminal domain-containing protein n=1 Tax=Gracilibacillus halophilus YIM-C55.5 TaxID=1308866 RepID=N4WCI1_9BACI|nr:sporulation membrane protein YtrI [Gracilibacillus halophilus]ENH96949.1 hypothetical protein J416_08197 [Gracilibacillus halophilus YIM-C55.5]